jgi:plasmid maintenance system antidote protein VapI
MRAMTQADLAVRIGVTKKHINGIVACRNAISPQLAERLEGVLGVPASFWNNREVRYQEYLARSARSAQLSKETEWLKCFPVTAMLTHGFLEAPPEKLGRMKALLSYFGVTGPDEWEELWTAEEIRFRKADHVKLDRFAVSAWIRQGELLAAAIRCAPYSQEGFLTSLSEVRALTTVPDTKEFIPPLQATCASHGVAIVFVPELPHTGVSGATKWLSPTKALIILSLRYKTNDHLWFTIFHEAGHIVKHQKRTIFLELTGPQGKSDEEIEANLFAEDQLIPRSELKEFVSAGRLDERSVRHFASSVGIAPAIVVGRLQRMGHLPFSHLNHLKVRYHWVAPDDSSGE